MIYIGSIFMNDNYDIIVFYIIVLKQLNTAAVSIFLGTGLCTGRIDLGAQGTGLGRGLCCSELFCLIFLSNCHQLSPVNLSPFNTKKSIFSKLNSHPKPVPKPVPRAPRSIRPVQRPVPEILILLLYFCVK